MEARKAQAEELRTKAEERFREKKRRIVVRMERGQMGAGAETPAPPGRKQKMHESNDVGDSKQEKQRKRRKKQRKAAEDSSEAPSPGGADFGDQYTEEEVGMLRTTDEPRGKMRRRAN